MGEQPGTASLVRVRVRIEGIVQGVGFRPFVHRLATGLGLVGSVGNDAAGVVVEVEGPRRRVDEFVARLTAEAPPLASVERILVEEAALHGATRFTIETSAPTGARRALVSPDVATCDACLAEIRDRGDRRYGYPLTNCTNCGPRYTIVRDVPYDRATTTMAGFPMCPECAAEYHDPADRRFHAQPTCCPACGPRLHLMTASGDPVDGDPVTETVDRLRAGEIVAIKGLGGYHLAVDARNEAAAARLRRRKHREDKPFAIMVADLEAAEALCEVDRAEADLLTSPAAPIVLLARRPAAPVAPSVAPDNRALGVMLAYTPLHHLLLGAHGGPLVLTSGNVSDEPIAYRDDDATARLAAIADAFLTHDRPIHTRVDDSVARVLADRPVVLRRSRGYAPQPLTLPVPVRRHVLAVGAELKNTVAVARGEHAFVSHHLGDLENYAAFESFLEAIQHVGRLFDVVPEVVAHDLHPEYLSTKYALDLADLEHVGVQHHHAHIASCLADNGAAGPVIGVAFDGTGYGLDGAIWGGEVLVADLADFRRVGSFAPVPLPGGAAAIREPWRMAAVHLDAAFEGAPPALDVTRRHADRWDQVRAIATVGVNSPPTSSAGRLFDAIAALVGVRDTVTYEGQAAIELEQAADGTERGTYPIAIRDGDPFRIQGSDVVRAVADDLARGVAVERIAARFHNAVVDAIFEACTRVRQATGLATVALSGGVFQNALVTERAVDRLRTGGFHVLTHRRVPPNDGGISLGQVVVAAARDRGRPDR